MFKHRQRVNAAFAKGLMFGKAVGARDECERIIELLLSPEGEKWLEYWYLIGDESDLVETLRWHHVSEFVKQKIMDDIKKFKGETNES